MKLSIKDNALKFFGYLLLFFGIFLFVVGIGMHIEKDSEHSKNGLPIVSIVKSYRRVALADIAQKLNISIPQSGKLL